MNDFVMPKPEHNSDGFWITSPRITSKIFESSPRKKQNLMSTQIYGSKAIRYSIEAVRHTFLYYSP